MFRWTAVTLYAFLILAWLLVLVRTARG